MKGKFTLLLLAFMAGFTLSMEAQQKKKPVIKTSTTKKPARKQPVMAVNPKKPQYITKKIPGTRVKITTDSGIIIVRLYDSTPLHRDNFVKLVKQGFYDSLMFHRVLPDFMIQGGDPLSKNAAAGELLGNGGDDMERITAEILPNYFHKRGVLAAARDGNPEMKSSACQFYLVQGKKFSDQELLMAEQRTGKKMTEAEKNIYRTVGGSPWLDGQYTVFGETEEGLDVIAKIANASRDANNRPLTDVRMRIEILSN